MQGVKSLLAAMSGVAALSMTTSVFALEMSQPDGWYAEGNVGVSHLSNGPTGTRNENLGAYNINIGYKIVPYAAVEGGYTKYKNTKIVFNSENIADVSHYSYFIAAKGIWPVADTGFEVFGKLGVNHMRARATTNVTSITTTTPNPPGPPIVVVTPIDVSQSGNSTNFYVGIGGQINIMAEMAIVAQWQRAQGNNSTGNEDLYSIGIAFIFV